MSDIFDGLGIDVQRLSQEGRYAISPAALPTAMDALLQRGKELILLGRTSNDESGRLIFTVEEGTGRSPTNHIGVLKPGDPLAEGIYATPVTTLVDTAEEARAADFSLRILGSDPDSPDVAQVQLVHAEQNLFPQDFWLNRVRTAPNVSDALMDVLNRRS
jgi:hypothetical protein